MVSKTQYSPLYNYKVGCEYCEVGNVIIEFSTSLMPKKAFQITRLRLVIGKTFSAFVMWKTQYSHVLLTVFSH